MSKPLYIFDLDGTLAMIEHRRHHVEGAKKDWRAFFAACVDDAPNVPVIETFKALKNSGAEVWVWSGRSDEVRAETVAWLKKYECWTGGIFAPPEAFRMRKSGDHQPDDKLKAGWLAEIEPPEWHRLTATFEDRDRMVQMYRAAGIACFQVAPGDF